MSEKFEQFVVARFEYLSCFLAGGMVEGSSKHNELSKKVLDTVSKQLHFVSSMGIDTAKRLLSKTSLSPLISTDKQELMCRLNDKVDMEADVGASSPEPSSSGSAGPDPVGIVLAETPKKATKLTQEHKSIHNYGTEQLWTIICSPAASIQTKLSAMALFLKTIGMRWISEKTAAACAALCRHFSILPDDSPDKALTHLRRLKEMLKLMWKDQPVCDVPADYPPTPEEFLVKYPLWYATAYGDGPPVASPVAWQVALLMYDGQPCRSTRAGVSPYMKGELHQKQMSLLGSAYPNAPVPVRMNQLQRAQHMQDMTLGPQQEPADLPWLKFCGPQRQVAVPGMQATGVAPQAVAGGVVMMDVHAGLEGLAGARCGDAAAAEVAPAPGVTALFGLAPGNDPVMEQEDAAVPPVMQPGLVALEDAKVPGPLVAVAAPTSKSIGMTAVAHMFREKHAADKVEAARKRIAEKEKETKDAIKAAKAELAKEGLLPITKGKAASAKKEAKKVVAAKVKAEPAAKVKAEPRPKVPDASPSSSSTDDSLAYRGTSYSKVRFYKKSTIYHDVGRQVWRVKPYLGSRSTIKKSFKANPKQAWAELVEVIREMNR